MFSKKNDTFLISIHSIIEGSKCQTPFKTFETRTKIQNLLAYLAHFVPGSFVIYLRNYFVLFNSEETVLPKQPKLVQKLH